MVSILWGIVGGCGTCRCVLEINASFLSYWDLVLQLAVHLWVLVCTGSIR